MTQRKIRARPGTTDSDEELACFLMANVLGVEVRRTDHGGKEGDSRTDLAFEVSGGVGIAEVVSTRDAKAQELAAVTNRKRHTAVASLTWLWCVMPTADMRVKDLHRMLPSQLLHLEELGVLQVLDAATRLFRLPLELRAIPGCFTVRPTHDHPAGYIFLEPFICGFPGSGDQALDKIERFLSARSDKSEKLCLEADRIRQEGKRVLRQELVVLLDAFSSTSDVFSGASGVFSETSALISSESAAVFRFLEDFNDPASLRAPTLPNSVTGLWLMPLQRFSRTWPVLHWSTDNQAWTLTRITDTEDDPSL